MTNGLIGRKLGMTRVFADDGSAVPVTVIEAGPCRVRAGEAPSAVQLGFGAKRAVAHDARPSSGHAKKAGLEAAPRIVQEFALAGDARRGRAPTVTVGIFAPGDLVKVTGTTKGRGFQGVVHRYGFGGGPASHGNTRHRKPGSIGPGTDPSRVIKGKRMPGHMGASAHTELGLTGREGRRRAQPALRARRGPGLDERHRVGRASREEGAAMLEAPSLLRRRRQQAPRPRSRCRRRCSTAR